MTSARNAARSGPRRQPRLPRHRQLDYILIPAPEDLSLYSATEKSPLPAIIVTPCNPTSTQDFAIAFLAPPRKPTLRERISDYFTSSSSSPSSPQSETTKSEQENLLPYPSPPISTGPTSPWRDTWSGWLSAINPPIALPVTSPTSGAAPSSWHQDAPSKRRTRIARLVICALLVFLVVFFHVFTHYVASADALRESISGGGILSSGSAAAASHAMSATVNRESGVPAAYSSAVQTPSHARTGWQGWIGSRSGHLAAMKHSGAAFVPSDAAI